MNGSGDVPLHRLLRRREAKTLLAEFERLLPESNLALVGAKGRIHAGSSEWDRATLQRLCAAAGEGSPTSADWLLFYPLTVQSRFLGALVARPSKGPAVEQALRCLHASLTLLLKQALETRDVVAETLDRYREINLLYRIGETIGSCLDANEIPHLVLQQVHHIIEADVGLVELLAASGVEASGEDPNLAASFGPGEQIRALRKAHHHVLEGTSGMSQATIADLACSPESTDAGLGPILCAPLKTPEHTLGALVLGRLAGQPEFTAGEGKLAVTLAHQAAISMETARLHQEEVKRQRLEEELAIGHQIQLSLLPQSCPAIPGWEFATAYRPARQVGGDLYDFVQMPKAPGHLGLVIADVAGKGIPAALFMAFCRTVLRSESVIGHHPAWTLRRVNRHIVERNRSGLLLTAFCATLDTGTGHLVYASGGHNWPLWLRADSGETRWLTARGFLLGAFADLELEEGAIDVAPGDVLVLYTDGVTEARSPGGDLFDEERLLAAVEAQAGASAQQIVDAIVARVDAFADDRPQADDLTLFVVKRQ